MDLILFDMDGTLVDSQTMIVAAVTEAFAEHGLAAPPREAVLSIVGLSLEPAMATLLALTGRDADPVSVAAAYKAAFAALRASGRHREPLFPGAREALDRLSARPDTTLGIATGKSRRGVDTVLKLHGLEDRFATIQTADDHPSKPHPSMVLTAMAEVGAVPAQTVLVGDTTFDVEMTRAAGARAIAVAWGYHPSPALVGAGADALIAGYGELALAVDRLLGQPVPA